MSKLFGVFDHHIPKNLDERITIVHGPNGYGKTTMLGLIDALFNGKDSILRRVPFDIFRVRLDNGALFEVKQERLEAVDEDHLHVSMADLTFNYREGDHEQTHTSRVPSFAHDERLLSLIDEAIPMLHRVSNLSWRDRRTGELLSLDEVLDRYEEALPQPVVREKQEAPDWLTRARSCIPVRLIDAQRLISMRPSRSHRFRGEEDIRWTPAVQQYTRELAMEIQNKLAEYATLSQSLDRSFPTRLLSHTHEEEPTNTDLIGKLRSQEEKRKRLAAAGLLDKETADVLQFQKGFDESMRNVLGVYVADVEQKLGVFDEILEKIETLKRSINNRFLYKELQIDKERGYVLVTSGGKELRPSDLSSGEQHEIVLNHELLFKARPNSLILIDEPELSFHVAWQETFLNDLQNIAKIARLDVILATHSPQIIHDRWDLTVELKGPPDRLTGQSEGRSD